MQLTQLINALKYMDTTLETNNFIDLYQELATSLNQARESPSPQVTDDILRLRKTIVDLHRASEARELATAQKSIYRKFGARHLLGNRAADDIETIFLTHSADPGGAANSINTLSELTQLLQQRVRILIEALGPLAADEEIEVEEGKTTIQLSFEDDASINTMHDLERHSERWNNILRAFSRLTKVTAEDAKILAIEHGSLLIALSAFTIIILGIAKAANEIMTVYEKYLNIKKLAAEAANLKLQNQQIMDQLETEAQNTIEQTALNVAGALMTEHGWTNQKGVGEVRTAIEMSIKDIFEFVRDGGGIDVYESPDTTNETNAQLREAFSRIRAIEGTIEQLTLPSATQNSNNQNDESSQNDSSA